MVKVSVRFLCGLVAGLVLPAAALAQNAAMLKSGEQVYRETCTECHGTGKQGAPRFGDKKAWSELIEEGQAVLTAHAWVGVRAMPPKGGNPDLTLEEFARATAWMASAAGGDWQAPDEKMLKHIRKEEQKRIRHLKKREKRD